MLKVYETTTPTGELSSICLGFEAGVFTIVDLEGTFALPDGALKAVMTRFGAPLDPAQRFLTVASLDLEPGQSLCHVRHLAPYDVIAKDYLVYSAPETDAPLCAPASTVAAALGHHGRALQKQDAAQRK
jgi:hypothetical protein